MRMWAKFENGEPVTGFRSPPPEDEEGWIEAELLDDTDFESRYGWDFSGDIPKQVKLPPLFEPLREKVCRLIDDASEQTRQRFLTPGIGQAMEYEEAYRQAKQYPAGDSFPMLDATVEAGYAANKAEAAAQIIAMHEQWELVGAQIRMIRLKAKKDLREATSVEQVEEIRDNALEALSSV